MIGPSRSFALLTTALLFTACSSSPERAAFDDPDASRSPSGGRDASADGSASGTEAKCEPGTEKARGALQSCCPEYGVDACGPMLACAALDGRTVPVCYPEKTRKYGETCTADILCGTAHCNTETGLCDGGPDCPPCDFPLTCTRQSFMRDCLGKETMFDESIQAPSSSQESLEAKPAGPFSGACMLDHGPGLSTERLACKDETPSTPWRVVDTDGKRRLIAVRVDYGFGTGECHGTTRYICPLP